MATMEASLAQCIEQSVSASATPEQRRAATKAYNEFKESKDPTVMAAALALCAPQPKTGYTPDACNVRHMVRHGALLLMEHWVRLRWNEFSETERTQLKTELFQWIEGTGDIMQEIPQVKEGICRLAVEIAKREWPQKWPELMPTLFTITKLRGMGQTELVLLTLLRIAEDVVQLQTLNDAPQRRKDIYQALTDMIPGLFELFFGILNKYYSLEDPSPAVMAARAKLLASTLITLTCYVEFVQLKEFLLDDVFKMLCFLLNDSGLRLQAANCLCEIAARKFKGLELEQLCSKFLKQEVMSEILSSIGGILAATEQGRENDSTFLLALCETLAGVSKQISASILQSDQKFEYPSTFVEMVNAVIQLCQHPSCVVARVALSAAAPLLKVEQKDASKLAYPPLLWTVVCKMIQQRLVFNDYTQSAWDFEDYAELKKAYSHFRSELCDLLRTAVVIHPSVAVNVGLTRLRDLLQRTSIISLTPLTASNSNASCAVTAEEWAGFHRYLDTVCSTIVKESVYIVNSDIPMQFIGAFDELVALSRAGEDNLSRLSSIASCCSALSHFIADDTARLGKLLEVVFAMGALELPGETRATRSPESREYRKHGTALFVRLCVDHPQQMAKHLEAIKLTISQRLTLNTVSGLERQHYLEGLTVLSNVANDPVAQSALLEHMLASDVAFFCADPVFIRAVENVQSFALFLGLQDIEAFERAVDNRANLTGKLMSITGVLKRCKTIQDRHVAFELISKTCLIPILKIVWLFKELFAHLNLLHPDILQSIMCLNEADKSNIFADNRPCCDFPVPSVSAAQGFVSILQETLSQFLVTCTFRSEFYTLRDDMTYIITHGMENLPIIKMRFYFHSVVRSLVKNCPERLLLPKLSSTFVPLMSSVFTFLHGQWQEWMSRKDIDRAHEESEATLETFVNEQVMHQMSRDLMEVMANFLLDTNKPQVTAGQASNFESVSAITTFGKELLVDESASQCTITIAFTALFWGDTLTSYKAYKLCRAITAYIVESGREFDIRCSSFMFGAFLRSLRVHGDEEGHVALLLSFGVYLYRWLGHSRGASDSSSPQPFLRDMLLQAGCNEVSLAHFERSIAPGVTTPQRKCKELFKMAVKGIIKESVSTQWKEEVHIQHLAPLWKMPKKRVDDEKVISLEDLFG